MNLKYNKDIKNNVFICDVIFDSYGTPLLTPEVEKSYVESFVPTIQYKDLSFKRYFNVVNNNVVEDKGTILNGTTTYTGTLIELTLNNRLVPIDSTLSISFSIDKNTIQDSDVNTILSSKELVCEAMVLCFQLTIDDAIKSALSDMRSKVNNFESQTVETL